MDQYKNPTCTHTLVFSALSSDLKLEIFDFVRSKIDQGNARLVSQEWNRLMRPRMWRDHTTSLRGTLAKGLHKLPEEQHACFHDIRALTVGGREYYGGDYDAPFSSFMDLLRNDQLLEFSSGSNTALDSVQLLSLLRHQSNLQSFRARLYDIAFEGMAPWTKQTSLFISTLHSLRSLRIYVRDRSTEMGHGHGRAQDLQVLQEYEVTCNDLLMTAAPLLNCLEIFGWRPSTNNTFIVPSTNLFRNAANPKQIPRTLRRLLITDMDISGAEYKLTRAIDFATLCSLKLEYCDNVASFLCTLAASFRKTSAQLKVLTVRAKKAEEAGDTECIHDGVKDLLCSFAGLEELELEFLWCGFMDWEASLGAHQQLKKLLVSSPLNNDGSPHPTEKIAHILEQCPNLQRLAYRPIPHLLGSVASCEFPFSLPSSFYKSLDTIAAAPTIRKLRVLYVPGFDDKWRSSSRIWLEKAGQIAHRIATLVLTHLHMKASNVSQLSLSDNERWREDHCDSNSHYYPFYHYRLQIVDLGGKRKIAAVPVRDYVAECPDAATYMGF